MNRRFAGAVAALVAIFLAIAIAGCGSDSSSPASSTTVRQEGATDYSGPGPYPVGVRVIDIDGARAWIWYPSTTSDTTSYDTADALPVSLRPFVPAAFHQRIVVPADGDAAVAKRGRFPVVLHSHGFAGFPEFESLHLAHVASWGFVVIAPDHTGRDISAVIQASSQTDADDVAQLSAALDRVRSENDGGFLRGRADLSKVATEGHSAGGAAAIAMARDPRVSTFIGLAPAAPVPATNDLPSDRSTIAAELAGQTPPDRPGLLLGGADDHIVLPAEVGAIYDWMRAPKTKVMVRGMGHNGFTDLCAPLRAMGGLEAVGTAFVPDAFLTMADDGCRATNLEPSIGLAIEGQVTVAWLRARFGSGSADSYSVTWLDHLFPGAIASYDSVS